MSGTLGYRLVIEDEFAVSGFLLNDPADPSDEHFYVTSKRRASNPFIEAPPEGEGSSVDPLTGAVTDGEYRVRVIDEPNECLQWVGTEIYDKTDLGLDQHYASNGWSIIGDANIIGWWSATATNPLFGGSVLFFWTTPPSQGYRTAYIEKTITGLTPGQTYGLTFGVNWSLDTGPGNIFVEIEGTTTNRLSISGPGTTIWTITTLENDTQLRLRAQADGAGEIIVRMGGELYAPSANVVCGFTDLSVVQLDCAQVGGDDRYVTRWLADVDARQRLIGRRAWIEQTTDNHATYTTLGAGYVTSIEMSKSLVYEFSIGDTRRVERTKAAWRDIDPSLAVYLRSQTALIGGPVFEGMEPWSPKHALPRFRVIDYQDCDDTLPVGQPPNGYIRLNYVSGPMPPGFTEVNTPHNARNTRRVINERAQPYFDVEQTWDTARPSGAFPGLNATLVDDDGVTRITSGLVPLGQNFERKQTVILSNGAAVKLTYDRGQEFINDGLEVLLRHSATSAAPLAAVNDFVRLLITPREPSEKFPFYWRGHPVDLENALYLQHGIPVNAASVTATKAALGADLSVALRFTDPNETIQDVVEMLHAAFGYSTRVNGDGERVLFVYRRIIDSTPSLSIVTNDLREQGGPTFRLHERSRRNRVVLQQQFWRTIAPDDEDIIGRPDAIATQDATATFDYYLEGQYYTTTAATDQGVAEERISLPGFVAWKGYVNGAAAPAATTAMSAQQWGAGLARQIFGLTGRGMQEATLVTRRDAADADAAQIGDAVELDVTHVPNARMDRDPTSQRGSTHWWRVTRRTESPEGAELQLVRDSSGVAPNMPVLPTLSVLPDDYDPGYFWQVKVDGAVLYRALQEPDEPTAWVEVEVAFGTSAPSGAGTLYTIEDTSDWIERSGSGGIDPYYLRIGPTPYNEAPWVRLRPYQAGAAPDAWTPWTSLGGSVGTVGTGIANLILSNVTATTVDLDWGNGDATNQIRISYRLNDTGAYTLASTEAIGATSYTITGLSAGSMYGVKVARWDGVAEVGTTLTGRVTMLGGAISSLTAPSDTASSVDLAWTNTDAANGVKVEYKLTAASAYGLWRVFAAGTDRATVTGLAPNTSYDFRVVLVSGANTEIGSALTVTETTDAASATLDPPTQPAAFASLDPVTGQSVPGLYGLRVLADTSNPNPHGIVIEEAVETAVGSGTAGSYSEVDEVPAAFSGHTFWTAIAPNDGKRRYLRAFSRLDGYTDSSATTVQSVLPWGTTTITPNLGSVTVRKNSGSDVGTRPRVNLIEGTNVTLTVSDDSTDNEVDVTINASSSGIADGDKGDISVSSSGTVWTIDNDAVTYAKIQNVSATSRVLGRKTSGAGDIEELTLSELLDFIGSAAQGDILYRGAASWARLGAGTSGQFLKTNGTGANPAWDTPSVSGGSLVDDFRDYKRWSTEVHAASNTFANNNNPRGYSGAGSTAGAADADGEFMQWTTGAVTGNVVTRVPSNYDTTTRQRSPEFATHVKTAATITNIRYWTGFFSTVPSGAADPGTAHIAAFRYDTGAGDTTWMAVVKDGTTISATSIGSAIATDTAYRLRLECSASDVKFYIDDVLLHTASSNLPSSTQNLGEATTLTTLTNAARSFKMAGMHMRHRW